MEFALTSTWSAKAEYMHYDLGSDKFQINNIPEFVDVTTRGDAVKLGFNYHLHRAPEPAPLK